MLEDDRPPESNGNPVRDFAANTIMTVDCRNL